MAARKKTASAKPKRSAKGKALGGGAEPAYAMLKELISKAGKLRTPHKLEPHIKRLRRELVAMERTLRQKERGG